jgi:hypothetical protein
MQRPLLPARVEQRNKLTRFRIDRSNVTAFPGVATQAGISEVLECGRPSVLPTNDMVNLVRRVGIIFVQKTVFTSVPGAFRDKTAKFVRNISYQAASVGGPAPWPE